MVGKILCLIMSALIKKERDKETQFDNNNKNDKKNTNHHFLNIMSTVNWIVERIKVGKSIDAEHLSI